MARRISSRTVINRKALNAIAEGVVAGFSTIGAEVIANTRPPDAEPFGEGLVTTGDWGVWAGTKKVAGTAQKPRAVKLVKSGVTLVVGYDFPARFQERGTIHQPARPFLTPSMLEAIPGVHAKLQNPIQRALARIR